jgi:hypothetical protein
MRLWGRGGSGDEQEPVSDIERLEQLLYRLADDIADDDGDDAIRRDWSRMVRDYAGQVGAGQPAGLNNLFRLFSSDPRNTINEQRFAQTRTFHEVMRLAARLLDEHNAEESRRRAAERGLVLRPWSEGQNGKAVVYKDGTVITSDNDAPGEPQFVDIHEASRQDGPARVATIGIGPDGSCDAYWSDCDERWLAARLHGHHALLHLEQSSPPP